MHSDLPEPLQGTRLATDPLFYFLKAGSVPDRSAAAGKEAHREEITMKRRTAKPPVREMCIFRPEPSEGVIPLPARHRACEGVIPPYTEINEGGMKTVCTTCFLSRDMRMKGGIFQELAILKKR